MPWGSVGKALALVLALGFVFSVQFIPHLATFERAPPGDDPGLLQLGQAMGNYVRDYREGYPWAIHVDEHFHASVISKVQDLDRLIPWDPYEETHGEFDAFGGLKGAIHERGYHIFMAQAQELTGISTYHLYQYGPAAWMVFTAFAVYALVRPHPAAIPAAAFVGLVPTTVRFLGPGFLVPIGFSLAWLPVAAILTGPARKKASAAGLLLTVVVWSFFVHLIAGFAALALVLGAALFSAGRHRKSAAILFLLGLVPTLWLARSFWGGIQAQIEREETLPIDFTIFDNFGFLMLFLWGAGIALYWLNPPDGDEADHPATAAFGALSLVALGLIVGGVVFDWNRYATYTRMHPIFFLTAALPAGYAVYQVGAWAGAIAERIAGWAASKIRRISRPDRVGKGIGVSVAVLVALATAAPAASQAVGYHLDEGYYRVMQPEPWDAYTYVDETLPHGEEGPYDVFLAHPWRAPFLVEMTGKHPYAVMRPGGAPQNGDAWASYLQGQDDLSDYVMNDITLVVGPRQPPGGVWTNATGTDYVWMMDEPYAEQIDRLRDGRSLQLDRLPTQG